MYKKHNNTKEGNDILQLDDELVLTLLRASGIPQDIIKVKASHTGKFLKSELKD